jgi:hypothetical protein
MLLVQGVTDEGWIGRAMAVRRKRAGDGSGQGFRDGHGIQGMGDEEWIKDGRFRCNGMFQPSCTAGWGPAEAMAVMERAGRALFEGFLEVVGFRGRE